MGRKAEEIVVFENPGQAVFDAACAALQTTKGSSFARVDPDTGAIRGYFTLSLASYGEKVEIFLRPVGPNSTEVRIVSVLSFGLVDWGKNRRNIQALLASMSQHLASFPGIFARPDA